jgi:hypothetical protein
MAKRVHQPREDAEFDFILGMSAVPVLANRDPTRGDPHAVTRVALPLETALTTIADRLGIPADDEAAARAR